MTETYLLPDCGCQRFYSDIVVFSLFSFVFFFFFFHQIKYKYAYWVMPVALRLILSEIETVKEDQCCDCVIGRLQLKANLLVLLYVLYNLTHLPIFLFV